MMPLRKHTADQAARRRSHQMSSASYTRRSTGQRLAATLREQVSTGA